MYIHMAVCVNAHAATRETMLPCADLVRDPVLRLVL